MNPTKQYFRACDLLDEARRRNNGFRVRQLLNMLPELHTKCMAALEAEREAMRSTDPVQGLFEGLRQSFSVPLAKAS